MTFTLRKKDQEKILKSILKSKSDFGAKVYISLVITAPSLNSIVTKEKASTKNNTKQWTMISVEKSTLCFVKGTETVWQPIAEYHKLCYSLRNLNQRLTTMSESFDAGQESELSSMSMISKRRMRRKMSGISMLKRPRASCICGSKSHVLPDGLLAPSVAFCRTSVRPMATKSTCKESMICAPVTNRAWK